MNLLPVRRQAGPVKLVTQITHFCSVYFEILI